MKQSKAEQLEILEIVLNQKMKKKITKILEELVIFIAAIILNKKVLVIEITHYQLKHTLIKLDHTQKDLTHGKFI